MLSSQFIGPAKINLAEPTEMVPPWRGWAAVILLPAAVFCFTPSDWPRWAFMWMLAVAIFAGCKWLTWRRTPVPGVAWWLHAGYLFAWPGMDPRAFLHLNRQPVQRLPSAHEWARASKRAIVGAVLFWGVARSVPPGRELLFGWLGIVALALMLHFGAFQLLNCAWRTVGVDARPLMDRPLTAVSVSEFWGWRWNTAFRDLTHRFLFRPLNRKLGPRGALVAVFLFSGLVHDLVISVPAGAGYGGPTLFFAVQAAGIFVERSRIGKAIGLSTGGRGWLFTMFVLAAPLYFLFHPPFVENVIVPFMNALGARQSVPLFSR